MSTVSTALRTFQSGQLYTACKDFFQAAGTRSLQDKSLPSVTLIANSVTTTPLASDLAICNSKGHERIIECVCLHTISKAT
jgi:hypothetical protein